MPYLNVSLFENRYSKIVGPSVNTSSQFFAWFLGANRLPRDMAHAFCQAVSLAASFALISVYSILLPPCSCAGDKPFNNPSNWGGTGLMETPNARILQDGEMRTAFGQADPFRWYSVGMGVLPGLEFGFTLTELLNLSVTKPGWSDYGNYKDKAFGFKYQILPESKLLPAIAFGLYDFHGTQLFSSQYLTFSRQVFPFDFTLGIGKERLRGSTTFSFLDDISFIKNLGLSPSDYGLFGGVEVALTERIRLMAEYNPIQYDKEKSSVSRAINEPAKSKFNYGARIELLPGADLSLSYQRGDTLGFMLSVQFELGKALRPWKPDPPRLAPADQRPFRERKLEDIVEAVQKDIYSEGFSNVRAYTNGKDLIAEFENTKYLSDQKAVGRVFRIALAHAPEDTKQLVAISKKANLPIARFSVEPAQLADYLGGRVPEDFFNKLIKVELVKDPVPRENVAAYAKTDNKPGKRLSYGVKPGVETFLNDPSGFFKVRLSANPWLKTHLWDGADAYVRYKIPIYSDVSTSNVPPPDAIRSDIVEYKGTNSTIDRLLVDQVVRLTDQTFGRVGLGYLELMYAGASAEILKFFGDGRIAVGVEGNWVRKRKPHTTFELTDFQAETYLGNLYYTIPGLGLTLKAQYGKFLAGDQGWMFEASRTYASGITLGAWYSSTDTDGIPGSFNKDYHEKGAFLRLPTRMFQDQDSPRTYNYAISPWTRDVAQNVAKWRTLFGVGKSLTPAAFKAKMHELKD